ncbi:MAG TPA: hypothetical protein VKB75_03160 [Jatrophihabitans sp.]|nr:hypothetical protein [Jatrophihabitans sp.]
MTITLPREMAVNQRTSTISQSRQYLDGHTLIAMAALFFLAFFIVLGVAVLLGRTPDTRDPEFSLGRVVVPRAGTGMHNR